MITWNWKELSFHLKLNIYYLSLDTEPTRLKQHLHSHEVFRGSRLLKNVLFAHRDLQPRGLYWTYRLSLSRMILGDMLKLSFRSKYVDDAAPPNSWKKWWEEDKEELILLSKKFGTCHWKAVNIPLTTVHYLSLLFSVTNDARLVCVFFLFSIDMRGTFKYISYTRPVEEQSFFIFGSV